MLEVEPFDALALSLHHSPGVNALLVGSGLSHSAGIPTGWEITLDLIRRLAALKGVTSEVDWSAWFQKEYSKDPNYSEILDALAATPGERRAILHTYIEPQEGEESRRPTKAHHAIARLVAAGAVRVIITTNFDRLIENALREVGIEPTVIASKDALAGASPLIHARCTIIKLHGDYLDSRIKNTDAELAGYEPETNRLLDEVFDQFGLVVVGWSGEWDAALRAALLRVPNRRYPFYWVARGQIAPLAQDIVAHRAGRIIAIADADSFFSRLVDAVDALQQASRPHPQSVAMAIALAKRYCRDDRYALEWAEFVAAEVAKIRSFVTGKDYPTVQPDVDSLNALLAAFVSRSEILRRACMICGRWGTPEANKIVAAAIRSLGFSESQAGFNWWVELREFAASLCFYWSLAGLFARDDFKQAHALMHSRIKRGSHEDAFVSSLPLTALGSIDWKLLKGLENHKTPASDFLFERFKRETTDIAVDPSEAEEMFDRLEFLISVEFTHLRIDRMASTGLWFWLPFGRYVWKRGGDGVAARLSAFQNLSADNPMLRAGFLGGTPDLANRAIEAILKHMREHPSIAW
jgi:SIR2-like domain